jgi:two-component system, NarL family, sensor kinase
MMNTPPPSFMESSVPPATRRSARTVAIPVIAFLLAGAVAVGAIATAVVLLWRHQAQDEAVRQARVLTGVEAHDVVGPVLSDDALVPGSPAWRRLDALVRTHVIDHDVVRVKIWAADGTIVYSDSRSLIGQRFALGQDDQRAIAGAPPVAEVSNLTAPENRDERQFGKLLEVYLGVRTPSGRRLLFETYQRYDAIDASARRIMPGALSALIAGLLLLYAVQAPLAYGLATRLRRARSDREQALADALAASDQERRRIAADLHDGVVQGLAGVSYTLSAVADRAAADHQTATADVVHRAGQDLRSWVRELRTLVVTIAPPKLHEAGLAAALEDLRGSLTTRGIAVTTDIGTLPKLDPQVETLAFRVAQEAVRNVAKHANARTVAVTAGIVGDRLRVEVADDGRGLTPSITNGARGGGQGLRLLADLTRSNGGHLDVASSPDGVGTIVRLDLPAHRSVAL